MRKLQGAAVVAALLGSVGFLGAGTAHADSGGGAWGGNDTDVTQSTSCKSHDLNLNILGNLGLVDGALGNALNGEGDPGAQTTAQGSSAGCNNGAFSK